MKALRPLLAALVLAAAVPAGAQPDNRLHYGSRPVNVLTIVSRNGIGTADATIMIRHTPEDAKYFCVSYAQDRSPECVARLLESVKVRDRVTGDCVAKTWTDMYGKQYAFLGRATDADQVFVPYKIKRLEDGELLASAQASGYYVEIEIFQKLCPGLAP